VSRRLLWLMVPLLLAAKKPPPPPPEPVVSVQLGVEKWKVGNYNDAVAIWMSFAQAGDRDALFNMGQAYKLGRGVPEDMGKARAYYNAAAVKGSLPAQANLGIILFQAGEKSEALSWLKMAADRGEPRAQYVLGVATFNGDGTRRSRPLGYGYLLRASASGLAQATTTLRAIEPSLSAADRSSGEAIAASLGAGAGVPAAFASSAPQVITNPIPSRPLPASPAVTTPPVVPQTAALPTPAPITATPATAAPVTPTPATAAPLTNTRLTSKPQVAIVAVPATTPAAEPPRPTSKPVETPVPPTTPPPAAPLPKPAVVTRPAPPPRPAPKPAAAGWRVQLGAFSNAASAEAAWATTGKAVSDLPGNGKPIYATGDNIVKLQMGPFAGRAEAQKACKQLSDAGRACFIVAP